jgi:hypothetical protein
MRHLNNLPLGLRSLRKHALIASDVSFEIARALSERGHELNATMPAIAHLVRVRVKAIQDRYRSSAGSNANPLQVRAAAIRTLGQLAERSYSHPLREMVSKYYALHNPEVLKGLKIEDIPFLAAGYMVRGVREPDGSYVHYVVTPKKALGILTREQPENTEFLEAEYRQSILPLFKWLQKNGVDVRRVCETITGAMRRGVYDQKE